jgi:hypothetical protein
MFGILTGTLSTRIRWSTWNMSTSESWMIAMLENVFSIECVLYRSTWNMSTSESWMTAMLKRV